MLISRVYLHTMAAGLLLLGLHGAAGAAESPAPLTRTTPREPRLMVPTLRNRRTTCQR